MRRDGREREEKLPHDRETSCGINFLAPLDLSPGTSISDTHDPDRFPAGLVTTALLPGGGLNDRIRMSLLNGHFHRVITFKCVRMQLECLPRREGEILIGPLATLSHEA